MIIKTSEKMEGLIGVKKFTRKKENFSCEKCGTRTEGTGYTDHCPNCLWSKHVDINPGDRRSGCGGIMEPIGIEIKKGKYIIYYECKKCFYKHKVRADERDDMDKIIEISQKPIKR
jgi:hypothetical protein